MQKFLIWLWFLSFVGTGIYLLVEKFLRRRQVGKLMQELAEIDAERNQLTGQVQQLSKYQNIVNVEAEIDCLYKQFQHEKEEAEKALASRLEELKQDAAAQQEEIRKTKAEIRRIQKEAEDKHAALLSRASEESSRILQSANLNAEQIAGDAYRALREAEHLQATVRAMQNAINGYGDEYLIPNHTALDDLAESYSHQQAGLDLQIARNRTRQMVNTQTAATCDYAENNRKDTAIRFVLDAFNGKVDSALSTVRHTNYGKLKQEIENAYSIVNQHGKAFRNARILPEYLEARQNELKWAVAVMELQQQEQEEQRRIKQEMREEEKARREYEKANKQAEKEEQLLKTLMKEAQIKMQEASEEEKAEYERKIAELEQKYREAEERNQRALSMAQQTKRGHVYVISNIGSFGEDVFKIGLTRRLEPLDRVKELSDASVPFDFDVHAMIYNEDSPKLEYTLHQIFADFQVNKVNSKKEFFNVGIKDIREALEKIGIEAKWTMLAEAKEFRETQALERDINHPKTIREPNPEMAKLLASSQSSAPENYRRWGDQTAETITETLSNNEEFEASEDESIPLIQCPYCGKDIAIDRLSDGINSCPHCNGEFEVEM